MIEYKGYTGVFEFDTELELFSGFVVDLRDQIYFEGESVEQLKASTDTKDEQRAAQESQLGRLQAEYDTLRTQAGELAGRF